MKRVVIIGNGISGITAAMHIRRMGGAEVTVVSSESPYFFSRTALMYVFMGHMTLRHTEPYAREMWDEWGITRVQDEAVSLDIHRREVLLGSGSRLSYDNLILATGSRPRRLDVTGENSDGVHTLYFRQDMEQIEATIGRNMKHAVIIGGGLLGAELAEMLRSRGLLVSMIVREKHYWGNVLPPEESKIIETRLSRYGVRLFLEESVISFLEDEGGHVSMVNTSSGLQLPCEMACVAIGVIPETALAAGTDIQVGTGFLVNSHFETTSKGIYAIGDCAERLDPAPGRPATESMWYTGRRMGECVARTICGQRISCDDGVWFNSARFFDLEYSAYGKVSAGGEHSLFWSDDCHERCLRIQRGEGDVVSGIHALGIRLRQEVCERWIGSRMCVNRVVEELQQARFDAEFSEHVFPSVIQSFRHQLAR